MKGMYIILVLFCVSLAASAQTKMYITKTHGIDSLLLSDIKNIAFKSPAILDSTAMQSQLVAYYPFNGNARDSSGNGNDGFIFGVSSTFDRFGKPSSAFLFDNCSYIRIPELLSADCKAFAIAAWVKQTIKDNKNHMIVFHGSIRGEATMTIANGDIGIGVNFGTGSEQNWCLATIPDTLKANTYYFLVARYIRGQKVDFTINGKIVASASVPNADLLTNPTRSFSVIGIHSQEFFTDSYCWNGVIDDVRVYSGILTDQEIQVLYHEGQWPLGQ